MSIDKDKFEFKCKCKRIPDACIEATTNFHSPYLNDIINWCEGCEFNLRSDNNSLKATSLPDRERSQRVDGREAP